MADIIMEIGLSGKDLCKIKIEGDGFEGENCVETIDEFMDLLGLITESQDDKPERQYRVGLQRNRV